jgi:hypothetical protein
MSLGCPKSKAALDPLEMESLRLFRLRLLRGSSSRQAHRWKVRRK